jgi:hypothetical protein
VKIREIRGLKIIDLQIFPPETGEPKFVHFCNGFLKHLCEDESA